MDAPGRWEHGLDLARAPRGVRVSEEGGCVRFRMPLPDRLMHLGSLLLIAAVCLCAIAWGVRSHHGSLLVVALRWTTMATACAGLAIAVPIAIRVLMVRRELVLTQGVLILREAVEATCLRESVRTVRVLDQGRDGAALEIEAEFSALAARMATGEDPVVGDDELVLAVLALRGERHERAAYLARVVAAWAQVEVGSHAAGAQERARPLR